VQEYVENSDCVIMLGAFITDVFLGLYTGQVNRKQSIIMTTEKARIGHRTYEQVRFKDFLEALIRTPIAAQPNVPHPRPAPSPKPLQQDELATPLTVEAFFRILGLHMGDQNTVVCDTGDALIGAMDLRITGRSQFLSDAYYLSMGFAVPASIGAMAAAPDSRVLCVVGDGAFQMTGIELSTAAKYGMAPIVFILNNDGYGTQRHIIDGAFNNILPWNYTRLTDLLGYGKSARVTTLGELEIAMTDALADSTLHVIEVVVPRHDSSPSLKRMGEQLSRMRDANKRG